MANYEINLTATQIEAALNKAHAPATVVDSTQNLVESGAIKTYVDTKVSAGASITTESFAGSALEDSTDGITATDTAIPTSKAVKDFVEDRKFATGWTTVTIPNNRICSGTAVKDMFFIATQASDSDDSGTVIHSIGNTVVVSSTVGRGTSPIATIYVPVAAGEDWKFQFDNDVALNKGSLQYKELT